MDRYCKVLKGSEFYDKLIELHSDRQNCKNECEKLALKYSNNNEWYKSINPFIFDGGIGAFLFKETPDLKIWKEVCKNGYSPKANTKLGKQIIKECNELPTISKNKLLEIFKPKNISGKSFIFSVGFYVKNKTAYFTYSADKWKITDKSIIDITYDEYMKGE